jgi:hypothetical protein
MRPMAPTADKTDVRIIPLAIFALPVPDRPASKELASAGADKLAIKSKIKQNVFIAFMFIAPFRIFISTSNVEANVKKNEAGGKKAPDTNYSI